MIHPPKHDESQIRHQGNPNDSGFGSGALAILFVLGAAALFAWALSSGEETTVLSFGLIKARRVQLEADVDEMLEGKSWWTQLSYEYPDCNQTDKEIRDLERNISFFLSRNSKVIREAAAPFCQGSQSLNIPTNPSILSGCPQTNYTMVMGLLPPEDRAPQCRLLQPSGCPHDGCL